MLPPQSSYLLGIGFERKRNLHLRLTGSGPGPTPPRELDAGEHAHSRLGRVAQSIVAAVRLVRDDQRVIEIRAVGIVAPVDPEVVGQPAAQVELGRQLAVDVPGQAHRRLA